jgi:hypothetical protein
VMGRGEGSGGKQLVEAVEAGRRLGEQGAWWVGGGPIWEEVACGPCLELAARPLPWSRPR